MQLSVASDALPAEIEKPLGLAAVGPKLLNFPLSFPRIPTFPLTAFILHLLLMAFESRNSDQLGRITDRLSLYQNQLQGATTSSTSSSSTTTTSTPSATSPTPAAMSRDPITCHVLNTLTGTPAANLRVTLTLLAAPDTVQSPLSYSATTDADGRVKSWTPLAGQHAATVPAVLSALPTADSKTNWSVRFEVGPWYEAQGVESFWPEVEVKFTVKGRGREGEEGWRHYHVPVLLGPWNYSTYRGS